jgi:membrane associated rhomboid family serine protease
MVFVPVAVDVAMSRYPWMNWVLMAIIVIFFLAQLASPETMNQYILGADGYVMADNELEFFIGEPIDESFLSLFGHIFLHADAIHLIGNLLFMWVFGNAVCAKVGNLVYPILFLSCGAIAGLVQTMLVDAPVIGASGAINGIVGFYLIYYPVNNIAMFYFIFFRTGTVEFSSIWMILLWLAFDIWGVAVGGSGVAYVAHLTGFALGASSAVIAHLRRWIEPGEYERTLVQILSRE